MRWVLRFLMFAGLIGALCFASYSFGKSQVKMVSIPIGVRILDGDGQPIRPPAGVKISLFKFGGSSWPRERWAEISGRPDSDGFLTTTTNFPLDPQVTEQMYKKSIEP